MHDSDTDVAPGTVDGVWVSVTKLCQSKGHSVEDGWLGGTLLAKCCNSGARAFSYLLVKVVVVVSDLADANWELGVHVTGDVLGRSINTVLGVSESRQALGVPGLHD